MAQTARTPSEDAIANVAASLGGVAQEAPASPSPVAAAPALISAPGAAAASAPQTTSSNNPNGIVVTQEGQPYITLPGKPRERQVPINLDSVMQGVWNVESGNRHHDAQGNVIKGPMTRHGQAIGVSQLIESTAKGLGVDPYDETQNREGGKRELATQFEKYGNWEDALAAYNWGPGNVDKWIAGGRDPSKMPAETRKYVPAVMASIGAEAQGPITRPGEVPQNRVDSVASAIAGLTGAEGSSERSAVAEGARRESNKEFLKSLQERESASDFVYRYMRGASNLVLGPIQAGLELTSPDAAREFTNVVNSIDDTLRGQLGVQRRDTWLGTAGDIAGTTMGILGGAGMIGRAAPELAAAAQKIPLMLRGAAGGAAVGATTFNPKPEESSRLIGGALGATVGALGATIARGVQAAAQHVSNSATYNGFIDLLRRSTADLTPSTTRLKDITVSRYEQRAAENTAKYKLRDEVGRDLTEGFPREGLSAAPERMMAGTRSMGIAPTATTRGVASNVDRELGGPEARAAAAAAQVEAREYARASKEWIDTYVGNVPPGARAQVERAVQDQVARGNIPPPPIAPPPFEPVPVSPEQFGAAMQAINRAFVRAKGDTTTRGQLRVMSREILDAAEDAARSVGMNVDDFLRASKEAGEFYRTEIVPLQRLFGKARSPGELAAEITPAKFYDTARRLIEGNDVDALRAFKRLVGERGNDELVRIAAHRAITQLDARGKSVADYIRTHDKNLEELVGRDGMQELRGIANIADRLMTKAPDAHSRLWRALYFPIAGRMAMAHGLFSGNPLLFAGGAVTAFGMPALSSAASHAVQKIKDYGMTPLLRRAARLRPDSPAMDDLMATIARRAERASAVAAQKTSESSPSRALQAPIARNTAPPMQRVY